MLPTALLATLLAFEAAAQSTAAFDPNALSNPNRLCNALSGVGLSASEGWGASRSTPGGYVCRPLGTSVEVGGGQNPTMLNAYVYGGGARKLDRFTLKLNIFNRSTADAGKLALLNAAKAVAVEMGIRLPAEVERYVRVQPATILQAAPSGSPRTLFRQQVGTIIVHVETSQSRVTSLLIHFRNPTESDLW